MVRIPTPTYAEAEAGKHRGMSDAEAGAGPEWTLHAREVCIAYLHTHPTMFCDDIWDDVLEDGVPRVDEDGIRVEMRALGPVFYKLSRDGYMRKSGATRLSRRSHNTEKPVWDSLVHGARRTD